MSSTMNKVLQAKSFARISACVVLCWASFASDSGSAAENDIYQPIEIDHSETLLKNRLEYYRAQYPEILIMNLEGGVDFPADMVALDLILGHQPKSLDYEHPIEQREDLMIVSFERIIRMLRYEAPSAAMFQADNPLGWQAHVCVLTINPQEVASDSLQATRNLLSLSLEAIRQIPHEFQLLPEDYLEFVIDHEIYHCLKSMYVGPQQRSHEQFWAEYNQFTEEQGADAFALAMHIKTRGELSPFANNIRRIRGMSLYNADPDHLTCKALQQVLEVPVAEIVGMSTNQIFELANRIKNSLAIDYSRYLQHLASAVQAMKEIGVESLIAEELLDGVKDIPAEPMQVKALVNNARRCLSELVGEGSDS
jgi:hypothetical protein